MKKRGIILIKPLNGKWELYCKGTNGFRMEEETREEAVRKARILSRRLKLELLMPEAPPLEIKRTFFARFWNVLTLPKFFIMKKIFTASVFALLLMSCGQKNAADDKTMKDMENPDKNYSHDSVKSQPGDADTSKMRPQ